MPGIDERLKHELERLAAPADPSRAFERVARKHARRRVARRLQTGALVVAVLALTVAGTYGLMRVFGVGSSTTPGDNGSPTAPPTSVDPRTTIGPACGISELRADFDGDGRRDTLLTYAPIDQGVSCDAPDLTLEYRMAVFLAAGERFDQPVPDCTWPYACRPFAVPDLDGNGRPDIALQVMAGASTVQVELFATVGNPWSGTIAQLSVAAPGDPEAAFAPGPARFDLYGSVTHQGALRCQDGGDGLPMLIYTKATMQEPGMFLVHETEFTLDGSVLSVAGTRDYTVTDSDPRFRRLEQGSEVCGASIAH